MEVLILLFNIPDESPDSVRFVDIVEFLDIFEEYGDHVVLDHRDDRAVHLWPCVACHARLAAVGASSVDEGELCVARNLELVEDVGETLGQSLVVYDEY